LERSIRYILLFANPAAIKTGQEGEGSDDQAKHYNNEMLEFHGLKIMK
jgi:hypothetical protein